MRSSSAWPCALLGELANHLGRLAAIHDGEDGVALVRWNVEFGQHLVDECVLGGLEIIIGYHEPCDETANVPAQFLVHGWPPADQLHRRRLTRTLAAKW